MQKVVRRFENPAPPRIGFKEKRQWPPTFGRRCSLRCSYSRHRGSPARFPTSSRRRRRTRRLGHDPVLISERSCSVNDVTAVEVMWIEKRIENRIRFGRPAAEKIVDRHKRIVSFAPGSIFAFVRWTANDYGTLISKIDILRTVVPGQRYTTVPWVNPGAESLLRLSSWTKVERVLQLIDAVEALGIQPADAAPDYWQHLHNRLSVNETPRPYTRSRHQAWLHRRRISP